MQKTDTKTHGEKVPILELVSSSMFRHRGITAVILFVVLPVLLWFWYAPPWNVTGSFIPSVKYLGQVFGVLGFSLFTLALLLSVRIPLLETIFGDLASAYRFHQTLGGLSVIILAFHPVFLLVPYLQLSNTEAALFFLSNGDVAKLAGLAGLFVFEGAIILTYFFRLPYHLWKTTHRFLGLAFLFGAYHAIFISGAIRTMPVLQWTFIAFSVVGLLAVLYRVVFHRAVVKRSPYRIASIESLGSSVTHLVLEPLKEPLVFRAGQFVYLNFRGTSMRDEHPFSICSRENANKLVFLSKSLGDDTSRFLHLKPGTRVEIEGPYGRFSFRNGGKRQLWIAGGIGITPFLSLAASLPEGYNVDFYYVVSQEKQAIALPFLKAAVSDRPIRIRLWDTSRSGIMTTESLEKDNIDLSTFDDFFVCGPVPMMKALQRAFVRRGFHPSRIHSEVFGMRPDS